MAARLTLTDRREGKVSEADERATKIPFNRSEYMGFISSLRCGSSRATARDPSLFLRRERINSCTELAGVGEHE
jgi:hypothetical protein